MSKFAIGEKVDNAADDHQVGTVIAVFGAVASSITAKQLDDPAPAIVEVSETGGRTQ
jgi:hypothetical protein